MSSMHIQHLIGGKPVDSRDYFETVNPATQEVLARVAHGGEDEVNAAVAAAKAAFPKWAGLPATERAKLMRKLGDLIAAHVPEIARTETHGHRPGDRADRQAADPARGRQLPLLRRDVHARRRAHLPDADAPELHAVPPGRRVRADQPVERAVHDRHLEGRARLAFGNTAVLKMSELSPLTAARLGELALEAGIPAGVLNVVHGYGKQAGEPLCRHPDVRAISFTGSTATGNRIVQAAGLKKFSMELGGKSPFVVFDDADLRARARRRGVHDLQQQRRALHRRQPHPGAAKHLCRLRAEVRRAREAHRPSATRSTTRRSSAR